LGHALVTFETFGRLMQEPRIASTMLWTTRWMNDADATTSQWYGLGPANEIKPAGRAVAMWGQFVREKLIAVDGGTPLVGAYASRSADGRQLTVWVVNRGLGHTGEVKVAVRSPATFRTATLYRFSGQGPDDTNPQWKTLDPETVTDNAFSVRWCPAVSVTVITLQP
ncbi:MAG: hypothetical protein NT049_16590, partial [Planctomycetota bacterium]|nr:hypothetical protein [Planctomycetota bacterium]